ncbi:MAG: hypothetical protein M1426_03975 [Patescibacteria group bacterium]|nr:hypothetical protein [Patescibacteria group bacterium]
MKKHKQVVFPEEKSDTKNRLKKQISYLRKLPPELIAKALQKKISEDEKEDIVDENYKP